MYGLKLVSTIHSLTSRRLPIHSVADTHQEFKTMKFGSCKLTNNGQQQAVIDRAHSHKKKSSRVQFEHTSTED
uniref:Protochlorophyllide reductase B n=1 Tax=Arundo donax TaxID=35708 RepID=A0A0A9DFK4_ARUDO